MQLPALPQPGDRIPVDAFAGVRTQTRLHWDADANGSTCLGGGSA
jgi:hypothetical protein